MALMKTLLLIALSALACACASNGPVFVNMSEVELAAYNRGLPVEEQVYCVVEATTSTFIRKRICHTYQDWFLQNERAAMAIDVLNSPPAYGLPGIIRDGPGG